MEPAAAPPPDLLCAVCMQPFGVHARRPVDVGCGWSHSYCEECIQLSPSSFRRCPECRGPARRPHINWGLVRLLGSLGSAGLAAASRTDREAHEQGAAHHAPAQPQQAATDGEALISEQPHTPAPRTASHTSSGEPPDGVRNASNISPAVAALQAELLRPSSVAQADARGGPRPRGQEGRPGIMLNPQTPAVYMGPGPGLLSGSSGSGGGGDELLSAEDHQLVRHAMDELPNTLQRVRSSFWAWAGPLLGLVYLLSPLDFVPDFLPILGWLDDLLVLGAVLYWVYTCVRAMQVSHRQRAAQYHLFRQWDLPAAPPNPRF